MLLEALDELLPDLQWYVADVDSYTELPCPRTDPTPSLVGDSAALIELARGVDQFLSGVFAGVRSGVAQPTFREGGLWTEDEQDADLGDAAIELRAFDTSYWSIGGDAEVIEGVRERLAARYGVADPSQIFRM